MDRQQKLFRTIYSARVRAYEGIPGPVPAYPFGNIKEFTTGEKMWDVMADLGRRYPGGICVVWFGSTPTIILNNADLIDQVLVEKRADYYKRDPRAALLPVTTESEMFIAIRAPWHFKRAVHPFSTDYFEPWLERQVEPMTRATTAHVESWIRNSSDGTVDLAEGLQALSFDAFGAAVVGELLGSEVYALYRAMGKEGTRRIKQGEPLLVPIDPRFYRRRRAWFGAFGKRLDEARKNPSPDDASLLGYLTRRGSVLPPHELPSILANIFLGGGFSAANGLATTLWLLSRNENLAARLRAEVEPLFAGGNTPDLAALEGCTYLESVLLESLRYLTPVPTFARNVDPNRATKLGEHDIPADTTIIINNWLLHRSPEYWDEPNRFNPDRWTAEERERSPLGCKYFFPFGRGPRTCIGQRFALLAMKVALAVVMGRARIELPANTPYGSRFIFGSQGPASLPGRVVSS